MKPGYLFLLLFASCTLPDDKKLEERLQQIDSATVQTDSDTNNAIRLDPVEEEVPLPKSRPVKKPSGIYQAVIPAGSRLEQTVAFHNDYTYELQEKYSLNKKDSFVRVSGTWSPSDGFIWLYKDQVVRGRYKWNGDTLQYFNPEMKKSISMNPRADILSNKTWADKKHQGVRLFGVGNEPFWSVEFNTEDTITLTLADLPQPLKFHVSGTRVSGDSTSYTATNDSSQIRLTVLPYFCSDGMSDFIYRNHISLAYKSQVLHGCGTLYR